MVVSLLPRPVQSLTQTFLIHSGLSLGVLLGLRIFLFERFTFSTEFFVQLRLAPTNDDEDEVGSRRHSVQSFLRDNA